MADNYTAKDASSVVQVFRSKDDGTAHTPYSSQRAQPAASGNTDSGTNADAVVTKAAPGAGLYNVLGGIYWSYDDDPTGGMITVEDDGNTVLEIDITAKGPGFLPFSPPLRNAAANDALVVTLADGGSGVTGRLSLHAWTE